MLRGMDGAAHARPGRAAPRRAVEGARGDHLRIWAGLPRALRIPSAAERARRGPATCGCDRRLWTELRVEHAPRRSELPGGPKGRRGSQPVPRYRLCAWRRCRRSRWPVRVSTARSLRPDRGAHRRDPAISQPAIGHSRANSARLRHERVLRRPAEHELRGEDGDVHREGRDPVEQRPRPEEHEHSRDGNRRGHGRGRPGDVHWE